MRKNITARDNQCGTSRRGQLEEEEEEDSNAARRESFYYI